jgi:hypothetical protein
MKVIKGNSSNFFHNTKRILILWIFFLFQLHVVHAQLKLVPLESTSGENVAESPLDEHDLRTDAALSLPFFEDFSTVKSITPGTRNWLTGGGVYINNTLSNSHPSLNIATFDGLDAEGTPYNLVNPLNQNFTDTLTSQPINLAGKTVADSVYLSFYWMAKGLGELPDSSDFFQVEFLSKTAGWVTVWKQVGYNLDTLFHQQFIRIADSGYFHDAFQFRFRSYGRNSGAYDTWHLDYIHLNAKRSVKQPYLFDVAMRKPVSPLLKRYTAMPLRQYRVNPALATSDSIRTDIVNHFNNFNILTSTFTITDAQRGTEYFRNVQRSVYVESLKSKNLSVKPAVLNINTSLDSVHLVSKFFVITTDTIPNVNLKTNDTITARVALTDYYAFDDGSAEYGVQVNQKLGRVAVQYVLSKPDTIGGVRIALASFNKDIAGQSFTIQISDNKNGRPDRVISQRSAAVSYPNIRNGFIDYQFANPVAVADTFYVGWLQINEQPVTVGFDRNSTLGKNAIFYNLGTDWAKETSLNGSIMIRPYLGKNARGIITGTETPSPDYFYPNPSNGVINWSSNSLKKIDIFNVQGNHVDTISPAGNLTSASVSHLNDGIYFLKATDGKRNFVQKVLIVK